MLAAYTNTIITNSSNSVLKSPLRLQSRPVSHTRTLSSAMPQSNGKSNMKDGITRITTMKRKVVDMVDSEDESDVSLPHVNGTSLAPPPPMLNGSKKPKKKAKLSGKAKAEDLLKQRKGLPIWTGAFRSFFFFKHPSNTIASERPRNFDKGNSPQ